MLIIKQQNFRLIQIESTCRRQNKCNPKTKICFEKSRKHCGLPEFSLFPTMFLKTFCLRVIKSQGCAVKS